MIITSMLIVGTVIVRGMSTCTIQAPNWIENTTVYVRNNKVGQILLTKHLIERVSDNRIIQNLNFVQVLIFVAPFHTANT